MTTPEALVRQWLSSEELAALESGWSQIDVVDLVEHPPLDTLFQWSIELFCALIRQLQANRSTDAAILVVPLSYSTEIDLRVPSEQELASIGSLVEVPGLYRTNVLVDAWQPVEQFRVQVPYDLSCVEDVRCFYTCWRTIRERNAGDEYCRNMHFIWQTSASG